MSAIHRAWGRSMGTVARRLWMTVHNGAEINSRSAAGPRPSGRHGKPGHSRIAALRRRSDPNPQSTVPSVPYNPYKSS